MDFWQQDKWNGYFLVKWHIVKDVPNPQLRHIILENNDNKPVTNSRDTQEVCYFMFQWRNCFTLMLGSLLTLALFASFTLLIVVIHVSRCIFPKVLKCSTFLRTTQQGLPYWMTLTFMKAVRKSCRITRWDTLCPTPLCRFASFALIFGISYQSWNIWIPYVDLSKRPFLLDIFQCWHFLKSACDNGTI